MSPTLRQAQAASRRAHAAYRRGLMLRASPETLARLDREAGDATERVRRLLETK